MFNQGRGGEKEEGISVHASGIPEVLFLLCFEISCVRPYGSQIYIKKSNCYQANSRDPSIILHTKYCLSATVIFFFNNTYINNKNLLILFRYAVSPVRSREYRRNRVNQSINQSVQSRSACFLPAELGGSFGTNNLGTNRL